MAKRNMDILCTASDSYQNPEISSVHDAHRICSPTHSHSNKHVQIGSEAITDVVDYVEYCRAKKFTGRCQTLILVMFKLGFRIRTALEYCAILPESCTNTTIAVCPYSVWQIFKDDAEFRLKESIGIFGKSGQRRLEPGFIQYNIWRQQSAPKPALCDCYLVEYITKIYNLYLERYLSKSDMVPGDLHRMFDHLCTIKTIPRLDELQDLMPPKSPNVTYDLDFFIAAMKQEQLLTVAYSFKSRINGLVLTNKILERLPETRTPDGSAELDTRVVTYVETLLMLYLPIDVVEKLDAILGELRIKEGTDRATFRNDMLKHWSVRDPNTGRLIGRRFTHGDPTYVSLYDKYRSIINFHLKHPKQNK